MQHWNCWMSQWMMTVARVFAAVSALPSVMSCKKNIIPSVTHGPVAIDPEGKLVVSKAAGGTADTNLDKLNRRRSVPGDGRRSIHLAGIARDRIWGRRKGNSTVRSGCR